MCTVQQAEIEDYDKKFSHGVIHKINKIIKPFPNDDLMKVIDGNEDLDELYDFLGVSKTVKDRITSKCVLHSFCLLLSLQTAT